jgi:putative hydrolase of the HAD superfamily
VRARAGIVTIRGVFFDLGNTLLHLDHAFIAGLCGRAGHARTGAAIHRAEYTAKWRIDAALGGTGTPDPDIVLGYFETLLAAADIPAPLVPGLADEIRGAHVEDNLWRVPDADVPSILDDLAARGVTLAVVSNADGRVEAQLARTGLHRYFATVIDSAVVGVEKPDPAIFRLALARTGLEPAEVRFVGDIYSVDVAGARAAGIDALLSDPLGLYDVAACPRIRRLQELVTLLDRGDL